MSSDKNDDKWDAIIRKGREHAPFWEGPDKEIKEWSVVEELLRSMHADSDHRYRGPVESVDDDPPDCVIRDSRGKQIGVEVTEFVDQDVVLMCQQAKAEMAKIEKTQTEKAKIEKALSAYRDWTAVEVREKVEQILRDKDEKTYDRRLYNKVILVIYTDEIVLRSPELFPVLDAGAFPHPHNIDEAYFICSYEPTLSNDENPYPYERLKFDGQTAGSRGSDLGD
jgi:hypothetical protein